MITSADNPATITLLLGGARSGKSALAVELATRRDLPVTFVATSEPIPGDHDLDNRVARHRAERPQEWLTIEEPIELAAAIERVDTPVMILDCLTVWIGNLMHHGYAEVAALEFSFEALAASRRKKLHVIAISNEVGLGIVPDNQLARQFRDLLGRTNQMWAAAADHSLLLIAGRALSLNTAQELLP